MILNKWRVKRRSFGGGIVRALHTNMEVNTPCTPSFYMHSGQNCDLQGLRLFFFLIWGSSLKKKKKKIYEHKIRY